MFAALHIPDFALQCVLRREPELRSREVAIIDGGLPARLRQMTAGARECGVTAGLTTTQALARCGGLLFRPAGSLAAESDCLLQCAEGFSPWLEATGEGLVTLELRGNEPAHFADRLVTWLADCGFTAQVGIARTPDLALLAAHAARPVLRVEKAADFLAQLPLEVLAADPDAQEDTPEAAETQAARATMFRLLHRWGIYRLGAFAALRREDVVSRLGADAAALWDRARGRAERPLRLVRAPEIFAEAAELEHEVETLEPLLFLLRRFLERLVARLEAFGRVAATLALRLRFSDGTSHARDFHIPAPTSDVEVLFRVLSTHLESVTAAAPIAAVELHAQPTRPERQQFSLFESGLRDPNKFFETLARLHALLGNGRVGTPVLADTHRDDAFHLAAPQFDETPPARPQEPPLGPPLRRYRPPLPAQVQSREGRPLRVFSETAFGEVTVCRGPWRSSGEWWDAAAWERTEWDIEIRCQLYRLVEQGGAWFLDGTYD